MLKFSDNLSEEENKKIELVSACCRGQLDSVKNILQKLEKPIGKETLRRGLLLTIKGQFSNPNGNHSAIINTLVQYGADVNHIEEETGTVPLHWAANAVRATGETGVLITLLDHGANPHNKGKNKPSPYEIHQRYIEWERIISDQFKRYQKYAPKDLEQAKKDI